jgi:nucleotide-binding universal stress UspA family protein
MAKRVLVPVDGSGVSESILPFLLELGNPKDLDIILLQVNGIIPPMAIEGTCYFTPDDFEGRRAEARKYLRILADELQSAGLRVVTRVRRGEPVDEILGAAREEAVDLIAMATHGRTGPARAVGVRRGGRAPSCAGARVPPAENREGGSATAASGRRHGVIHRTRDHRRS